MATNLGTAVNFGFKTTTGGITITGVSGVLLQSAEHTVNTDREEIRDGDGDVVAVIHYNKSEEAVLEAVITGTGLADAITNTALRDPDTLLVITACASMPSLIQTNWEVISHQLMGGNTAACKMRFNLRRYAGVTAAASA